MTTKRYTDNQRVRTDGAGHCTARFQAAGTGRALRGTIVADTIGSFVATIGGVVWSSWAGSQPSATLQVDPGLYVTVVGSNLPANMDVNLLFLGVDADAAEAGLGWPASNPQSTVGAPAVLSGVASANVGADGHLIPATPGVSWRLWMLSVDVAATAATASWIQGNIRDPQAGAMVLAVTGPQATAGQATAAGKVVALGGLALPVGHGLDVQTQVANTTTLATALYSSG